MTDPTLSPQAASRPAPQHPVAPPHAQYGVAHQAYPGAPPTWTVPPQPTSSAALAATALALSVLGVLAAFVPLVGVVAAWLFLGPGIVLAIIALVKRMPGRGMSIASLVVAAVGVIIAMLWGLGFAALGSWFGDSATDTYDDGGYEMPDNEDGAFDPYPVLSADTSNGGSSRADALPYGSAVTLSNDNDGQEVWSMSVGAPQDVTATAAEQLLDPENGAYLAVPVELTNLTDDPLDVSATYGYIPMTWILTGDGGRADTDAGFFDESLPGSYDISVVEPGESVIYFELFDVGPSVASSGYLVADLTTNLPVYWGPVSGQ